MWTLVRAQFRYHAQWMILLLAPTLLFAAVLTGLTVEAGKASALWTIWVLLGGLVVLVAFYHQDLKERRPLLWLELPLTPRQVIGARLLIPLLVHAGLLLLALAAIALLSPTAFERGVVLEVLSGNGLAMLVSYSIYAGEEVGIRLMNQRFLFWFAQIAFAGALVLVALDPVGWFPEIDEPAGIAGLHAVALFCAVSAYRLYQTRTNFLMGTDPNCGLPVDWSQSE